MDHNTAVQEQAVERYLLGELSPSQQEAFEEHFFTCQACSADLRDADALVLGVRRSGRESAPLRPAPFFRMPAFVQSAAFSLALVAALGLETAYLLGRGARPDAPREIAAVALRPGARAASGDIEIAGGAPVVLMLDLPPDIAGPLLVLSEPGSLRVEAPSAGDGSLSVYLPAGRLAPGRYSLIVQAPSGKAVSRYPLTVR